MGPFFQMTKLASTFTPSRHERLSLKLFTHVFEEATSLFNTCSMSVAIILFLNIENWRQSYRYFTFAVNNKLWCCVASLINTNKKRKFFQHQLLTFVCSRQWLSKIAINDIVFHGVLKMTINLELKTNKKTRFVLGKH